MDKPASLTLWRNAATLQRRPHVVNNRPIKQGTHSVNTGSQVSQGLAEDLWCFVLERLQPLPACN